MCCGSVVCVCVSVCVRLFGEENARSASASVNFRSGNSTSNVMYRSPVCHEAIAGEKRMRRKGGGVAHVSLQLRQQSAAGEARSNAMLIFHPLDHAQTHVHTRMHTHTHIRTRARTLSLLFSSLLFSSLLFSSLLFSLAGSHQDSTPLCCRQSTSCPFRSHDGLCLVVWALCAQPSLLCLNRCMQT